MSQRSTTRAALVLVAAALARPLLAQPAEPRITLNDALGKTLELSPDVALAMQDVRARRGAVQTASGQFDNTFDVTGSFTHNESILTPSGLLPEINRRTFLTDSFTNLNNIATDIGATLRDPNGAPNLDCAGNQYYINGYGICSDKIDKTDTRTFELLLGATAQLSGQPPSSDPISRLQATLAEQNRRRLTAVFTLLRRVFLPALRAQSIAIGALPTTDLSENLEVDISYNIPLRNGIVVGPLLGFQGTRSNFIGKPESPVFGGKGIPSLYRAFGGFSLDVPLGKQAGFASVAATETSSRMQYEAAVEGYVQTASEALLRTETAYWNLAAAQETYALLERSAGTQRKIGEISDALVKADELPRADMSKTNARTSDALGSVEQARQTVTTARIELARAIGLTVADMSDAPLAADPLPPAEAADSFDTKTIPALAASAVERRADVKSERRKRDAAQVLVKAARADLKPFIDLSLMAGWTGFYEDPQFKATSLFDFDRYYKGATGKLIGPSLQLNLTFQLPVGNDTARGRLVQSEAVREQADVSAKNLERVVRTRVFESADSAKIAAGEVGARRSSTARYEEVVETANERYRAGETSLMDTILTERSVTQALLDLVGARQTYAARMARLRFETGALLPYTTSNGEVSFGTPAPLGFSFTGAP